MRAQQGLHVELAGRPFYAAPYSNERLKQARSSGLYLESELDLAALRNISGGRVQRRPGVEAVPTDRAQVDGATGPGATAPLDRARELLKTASALPRVSGTASLRQ